LLYVADVALARPTAVASSTELSEEKPADFIVTESTEEAVSTCAVMECSEVAVSWCAKCQLSFCADLHTTHSSHSAQTKKVGYSSKSSWEEDSFESRQSQQAKNPKKRNADFEDEQPVTATQQSSSVTIELPFGDLTQEKSDYPVIINIQQQPQSNTRSDAPARPTCSSRVTGEYYHLLLNYLSCFIKFINRSYTHFIS
jgi:hypothetical protein